MKEKIAKLFKNKIFAIVITCVAVALTAVYVYLLARPVAYGMAYTTTKEVEVNVNLKSSVYFNSNGSLTMKVKYITNDEETLAFLEENELDGVITMYSAYIIVDGKVVMANGEPSDVKLTNEEIKALQDATKAEYEALSEEEKIKAALKVNAFVGGEGEDKATCTGSIVIAAVLGFFVLSFLTAAGTSLYLVIKKK